MIRVTSREHGAGVFRLTCRFAHVRGKENAIYPGKRHSMSKPFDHFDQLITARRGPRFSPGNMAGFALGAEPR
ncbi:MAG: hypothetical protein CM15mP55_3340 [Hyphomicrobiales bacterium]|nr:MAG: hypothetical protein CM15mP55_3340 [Hyphomicrobiales bacterium]